MSIYEYYEIKADRIQLKFNDTIDVSTLINTHFILLNVSATPSVAGVFNPIQVTRDYYSTSRSLYLYPTSNLTIGTHYTLMISGLKTVMGIPLPTDTISFTPEYIGAQIEIDAPPTRIPTDVEDYSIKDVSTFFPPSILTTVLNEFRVLSIKPTLEDSAYLLPGYNEGRIEITFSAALAANYISNDYFKMEKKAVSRGISRWETVNTLVTSNSNFVIIYMPSTDTVPEYGEPDLVYYEDGFKYRLRISADVGPAVISGNVIVPDDDDIIFDGGSP